MLTVRPKKSLGQHFLNDLTTARRIADTVDAAPGLPLLEVGPGTGVLTQFLAAKGRQLKAVEKDRESVVWLEEHFPALAPGIIAADFLRMDLAQTFGGTPFALTGNYPYNISSQIFFKLVEHRDLIPLCTGMVQKEVAERLAAGTQGKERGILSVAVQLWYDVEYLFTVEPGAFTPPPKVRSGVVRLTRNARQELPCDEHLLRTVVKTTFGARRKMLRGTLKTFLGGVDEARRKDFLARPDLTRRPEELTADEFIALAQDIAALPALQ